MERQYHFYGKKYRVENEQINWIFRRFVHILNKRVRKIEYRTPLRDPEKPRSFVFGLWADKDMVVEFGDEKLLYQENTVYIDPEKCHRENLDISFALLHELSHALYSGFVEEKMIWKEEKILFRSFSQVQKKALCRFLPKI